MKKYFGVSSLSTPANLKLKNGYTMYDWVMRQHCFPAFWGRGLTTLTPEEVDFLKKKQCKVFLMVDGLDELAISRADGTNDALNAVAAAQKLGVPQNENIALFVKVEPDWSINHNWMISFARTLSANGYMPGFIGNTDSSKNFVFDRQCGHFVNATAEVNQFGAIYGATEPKCEGIPEEWTPYCPSVLNPEHIGLWFCDTTSFDEIVLDDVYVRDENALEIMW